MIFPGREDSSRQFGERPGFEKDRSPVRYWVGGHVKPVRIYESDFGWGRPVKVDVVSIRGDGISMAEKRDDSGGVEIGLCMKKADMDIVFTLFNSGLQN
ncbi:hypothetical protein F2Q69_00020445 [Brassica cretica]|uniref:Uncharacterized protein n=1 Tax=Brassica cretica TaxID=69181 RepID=A0A8S9QBA7_BRACR|nr:hypothetical protein F2Q69_00020445 [Brassica cretica]